MIWEIASAVGYNLITIIVFVFLSTIPSFKTRWQIIFVILAVVGGIDGLFSLGLI